MSPPLILRAFVKERLSAAAEEIFQVFEKTIEKYEEEASSSKQEIERLRALLLELVSNHKQDLSQSSICKEETPLEQHLCEQEPDLSADQREPQHIKEEAQELPLCLASQQQVGEMVQDYKDANVLNLPQSSFWDKYEHEVSTLPLQLQTQNKDNEEQFQELAFSSSPSSQTQIQDGRENESPDDVFMSNQTQTEHNQSSIFSSMESTQLLNVNSVAPDYHCYLCNKSFSLSHHLIKHAFRMHLKDAGLLCAVCGKTLESVDSLNVHLKSHRGSRCCHVCGKYCSSTTALSEHMTSHTGVKLHRCHMCGKECSRKGDLKIHMRIHTGEKPFCCSYCCKGFTHSGHLRKHMRSHTGERPHRCDVCGKGFLQSTHLKYHLGTHAQKY
ncbi:zinc finger protein 184-like [Echeneis naucrates]|nr:zinc finger protein 184-like [Echeneis naucrates]